MMAYTKYRKHPRVYQKQVSEKNEERSLVLSAAAAVGIVALAFAKGVFLGYMLKRRLD